MPDVSANVAKLVSYVSRVDTPEWGTSIAAPIWASIFTLINEKRSAYGKGPVGFVNPTLYEHHEVFQDIVQGVNPGCGTQGFLARPGWDPDNGFGYAKLSKVSRLVLELAVMSLQ